MHCDATASPGDTDIEPRQLVAYGLIVLLFIMAAGAVIVIRRRSPRGTYLRQLKQERARAQKRLDSRDAD